MVAVIDGMGGGLGAQLVGQLSARLKEEAEIVALGTNAIATNNMLRAGAVRGATGENAIRVNLRHAAVVVGPIGIIMPHALMGEITPDIAEAVALCAGRKVLIPVSQSHVDIVGLETGPLVNLIREAVHKTMNYLAAGR